MIKLLIWFIYGILCTSHFDFIFCIFYINELLILKMVKICNLLKTMQKVKYNTDFRQKNGLNITESSNLPPGKC